MTPSTTALATIARVRRHRRAPLAVAAVTTSLALVGPAEAKITLVNEDFDLPGNVAAGRGWSAMTQADGTKAKLYVGKLGTSPVLAEHAAPIIFWTQPHIGTDARGHAVIVYPSCVKNACDLHALDPATGADAPLPGASSPGVNEVEGDLDRGALAYVTAPAGRPRSGHSQLRYRPAGGPSRILDRLGGGYLDLDRGRILTVRSGGDGAGDGTCGSELLELTTVATRTRTLISRQNCGQDEQTITGAGFVGKRRVAWSIGALSGSTFAQRDLAASARTQRVHSIHKFIAYAPVSSTRGLIVGGEIDYATGPPSNPDDDYEPGFPLYDVTGIQVGAKNGQGQNR